MVATEFLHYKIVNIWPFLNYNNLFYILYTYSNILPIAYHMPDTIIAR